MVAFPNEDHLGIDGRWPPYTRFVAQWVNDQVERLMDAGARTDRCTGKFATLQVAFQTIVEEFSWVAGQGKPTHVDSAWELAE